MPGAAPCRKITQTSPGPMSVEGAVETEQDWFRSGGRVHFHPALAPAFKVGFGREVREKPGARALARRRPSLELSADGPGSHSRHQH